MRNSIIVNILIMVILSILIVVGIAFGLSYYTRHDESIIIPQLRGYTLEVAKKKLNNIGLGFEVTDSVYTDKMVPSGVFESLPKEGSSVKKGRVIYLTINATSPMRISVPDISNISLRQAIAKLKSSKINNITVKETAGDFDDLCIGLETLSGNTINPNTMIDINMPVVVVVSKKMMEDSTLISPNSNVDDDWLKE